VKDLETIAGRNLGFLDQSFMDGIADVGEKLARLAFAERDGDQRHGAG